MLKEQFFTLFSELIINIKRAVIVSHVNPDGDAIGSSLALQFFLKKLGVAANVIIPNDFPSFLQWLPGTEDILIFDKNSDKAISIMNEADLFCFLDFNSISRTGLMHNDLCHLKNTPRILIDHHRDTDYSQYAACLSEVNTSSTAELVAELIEYYGFEKYLDDKIRTNLLVGIMTDTGSFAHSIHNPETFSICANLLSNTINYPLIHRNIYDTFSQDRMRLLGYSINKMEILPEYKTAYITLSKEELEKFHYQVGDTEGIVNYPLSIKGVTMSVLITERQGVIRFSFRSKGDFSVHEVAKKYFNGGGHTNAAGGTLNCQLVLAVAKLLSILPEYKSLLNE